MNQARLRMEKKLQRAEEKRQILLQMKVKKAHEEDTKVIVRYCSINIRSVIIDTYYSLGLSIVRKDCLSAAWNGDRFRNLQASEIAFINTLEAQNKRHEIMAKHQESEARLQDMQVMTKIMSMVRMMMMMMMIIFLVVMPLSSS